MSTRKVSTKFPPVFIEGDDYDQWKKDVELWQEISDLDKAKHAIAIHLSLSGRSRDATSELSIAELKSVDGITKVFEKLDRVYALDENWKCFHTYLNFENYSRPKECSVDEYLSEFDKRYYKLKECKVTLPDAIIACRLLKSCNLSDVHFQLALSTTPSLTFDNMRTTLKKLFSEKGQILTVEASGETVKIENEAFYTNTFRYKNKFGNFSGNSLNARLKSRSRNSGNSDGRLNPLKSDGSVSVCAICSSKMHWAKFCPHAYEKQATVLYSKDERSSVSEEDEEEEEVQITLLAENERLGGKLDTLLGETIGKVLLDSGCSKTVCGQDWLDSFIDTLCKDERNSILCEKSSAVYRFGDGNRMKALKSVTIPCILAGKKIKVKTDVVDCTIPLLLSRSSMKRAGMIINLNDDTVLVFGKQVKLENTSMGHYILPITHAISANKVEAVLITSGELEPHAIAEKLHKQFAHPTKEKLKIFLREAGVTDMELLKEVDNATESCETCRRYKRQRPRPVVAFNMGKTFNHLVSMDLKYWNGVYFLVMVDTATRFCRACVISNKKPDTIIQSLFVHWISLFGAPRQFLMDNGTEFNNENMRSLGDCFGIQLVATAAESPWSNSICERMNGSLASSVQKIMHESSCSIQTGLSWAVAARNALHNCHGYSPNQLVFGYNPATPNVYSEDLPVIEGKSSAKMVAENLRAMHDARLDFLKNENSEKIRRALLHQVRGNDVEGLENGDKVLYKRKDSEQWHGPAIVIGKDGKQVLVRHGGVYVRVHTCRLQYAGNNPETSITENNSNPNEDKGINSQNSSTDSGSSDDESEIDSSCHQISTQIEQVSEGQQMVQEQDPRMNVANNVDLQVAATNNETITNNFNQDVKIGQNLAMWLPTGEEIEGVVLSRAGKAKGKYASCYNVKLKSGEIQWMDFDPDILRWCEVQEENEVLMSSCLENDSAVLQAKQDEIENWQDNGVYEEVEDEGQSTMSVRWVLTEKNKGSSKIVKARLVARGFEENKDFQTDSPTCAKESLRVGFAIIAMRGWSCHSLDIKAAYLQGEKIERDVFLKPPKEFDEGKIWKLNKTVYGLCDAARAWYFSVKSALLELGMNICQLDQALFLYFVEDRLEGLMMIHVDDFLWAGSECFRNKIIKPMYEKFQVGSFSSTGFKYVGLQVDQECSGKIRINQNNYIKSLKRVRIEGNRGRTEELNTEEKEQYRSLVGQLGWVSTQTRPDISFDICELSSVFNKSTVDSMLKANKVVTKLQASLVDVVFIPLSDQLQFSIECFCDSSFGNLNSGGSQGGYLIFLSDEDGKRCPIAWQSKRLRRVVKSTIAAETLALMDAAEAGVFYANLVSQVLAIPVKSLPVKCYVDNKSLVDAVHSTTAIEDKMLRINMAVLRDMLASEVLASVEWVKSAHQLANALTKSGACPKSLLGAIGGCSTRQ